MTDSAVAETADTELSSRRSLLGASATGARVTATGVTGTGVLGAGVLGAVLALGVARSANAAPTGTSDADRDRASFAISLELTARDLYQAAIDGGAVGTAWPILRQQHAAYAERLAGVVGVSADTRNDAVFDQLVGGFADAPANAGFSLENTAAATHIALLGMIVDTDVAEVVAAIAAMESRHATFLAERSGRGNDLDALFSNPASPLLPEASS